jgi:hypothetical protein
MGFRYFSAKPFLAAAIIITFAGLSMTISSLALNQSMKSTAPSQGNLGVFATEPCRGLSLPR